uniref:Uncharacterized protein n=1 Tax=Glossina austeni TaxID=7395 RepID=A0A1A9VTD6_GLOAU
MLTRNRPLLPAPQLKITAGNGETDDLTSIPLSCVETGQTPTAADVQNTNRPSVSTLHQDIATYRNDPNQNTQLTVPTVGVNRILTKAGDPRSTCSEDGDLIVPENGIPLIFIERVEELAEAYGTDDFKKEIMGCHNAQHWISNQRKWRSRDNSPDSTSSISSQSLGGLTQAKGAFTLNSPLITSSEISSSKLTIAVKPALGFISGSFGLPIYLCPRRVANSSPRDETSESTDTEDGQRPGLIAIARSSAKYPG